MRTIIDQLVQEATHTHLVPILEANRQTIMDQSGEEGDEEGGGNPGGNPGNKGNGESKSPVGDSEFDKEAAPIPGAMRAPDGYWYLPDPTQHGGWLRIAPPGHRGDLRGQTQTRQRGQVQGRRGQRPQERS
jgi:hypothetical protein